MSRYVDLYLDTEPEYEIEDGIKVYNRDKYYAVTEILNKSKIGTHWHVLVTAEQLAQRKIDKEACITLSLAADDYKYTKIEVGNDYDHPLHVFGRGTHDPEILAAKAEL
jgi:hypothetical protein